MRRCDKGVFFLLTYSFLMLCKLSFSQTVIVNWANNSLTMMDAIDSTIIISSNNQPLWEPFASHPYSSVTTPGIHFSSTPSGYDITYTFSNSTTDTVSLGKINIAGIRFDSTITFRNFERDGAEIHINHQNRSYQHQGSYYPFNLYSPVAVLSNNRYTIGISIQYPVLEYESALFMKLDASNTNGGRNWTLSSSINQFDSKNKYSEKGNLLPGQTKQFVVSIRVIKKSNDCDHWLKTLFPYKNYFDSIYNGVKYTRDPRPIKGYQMCFGNECNGSPDTNDINPSSEYINPYCFRSFLTDNNLRPDIYGFGPFAHYLANYESKGYNRLLLWSPSGLYLNTEQLRYCYKFSSHWLESDPNLFPFSYGHKMNDAIDSLSNIVASPLLNLGFWWGRSGEVMYDWDTAYYEPFNLNNPAHIAAGFKELDLAVAAGGTLIGLDAFKQCIFPWDGYKWIQMMKQRAPHVKFCTEKGGSDITNTLAAFFFKSDEISEPHYLSDFLLPGNEKWLQVTSNGSLTQEAKRVASLGYVPVIMSEITIDSLELFTAVKGWEKHLPFLELGNNIEKCQGDTFQLSAHHSDAIQYFWSTGETTATITAINPGTYWVKTRSHTGCRQSDTVTITALASPAANFNYSLNGLSVTVNNNSSNSNNYFWDYGDGNTDTSAYPTYHTYTTAGNYTVTLIAYNSCSSDTMRIGISLLSTGSNKNKLSNLSFRIFPNPVVNNEILIEMNKLQRQASHISLINALGDNIFTIHDKLEDNKYQIKNLASGIYFLIVSTDYEIITEKIIVK